MLKNFQNLIFLAINPYAKAVHSKPSVNNKSPLDNIQNRSTSSHDTSATIPTLIRKVKELENKFKVLSDLFNDIKEEVLIQKRNQGDIDYYLSKLEFFTEIPDDDIEETIPTE